MTKWVFRPETLWSTRDSFQITVSQKHVLLCGVLNHLERLRFLLLQGDLVICICQASLWNGRNELKGYVDSYTYELSKLIQWYTAAYETLIYIYIQYMLNQEFLIKMGKTWNTNFLCYLNPWTCMWDLHLTNFKWWIFETCRWQESQKIHKVISAFSKVFKTVSVYKKR